LNELLHVKSIPEMRFKFAELHPSRKKSFRREKAYSSSAAILRQGARVRLSVVSNQARLKFRLTKKRIPVYSMPVRNKPMTETNPRDLFPGALEMMILESLRRQPAHGYALVQHIQQRSNNLLQVEEGSLYPALQRLLKSKLVKAEWGVSSTNRRVRTYQITASGMRHLEQQISSFERMFEGIALVLNPGKSPAS
jgi:transcriptional regulator